jgi:hypothetical protein
LTEPKLQHQHPPDRVKHPSAPGLIARRINSMSPAGGSRPVSAPMPCRFRCHPSPFATRPQVDSLRRELTIPSGELSMPHC